MLKSILQGYKEATTDKRRKQEYEFLASHPLLHSSEFLDAKLKQSTNRFERECILDHMLNHDTHGIESYDYIEDKIIDMHNYWRD